MRRTLAVALLLHPLLLPGASLHAQTPPDGQWRLTLSGGPSAFRLDLASETSWRTSANGRVRLSLGDHLHFETAMTVPLSTKGVGLNCPDEIATDCVSHFGEKKFSVVSGAFGFHTTVHRFTPYLGVGRSRFTVDGRVQSGWLFHSGSEFHLTPSLGLILDYRLHRVEWDQGGIGRNQEWSLGFSYDLHSGPAR